MKILSKINKKNKELIIESLFFIIVSSLIYAHEMMLHSLIKALPAFQRQVKMKVGTRTQADVDDTLNYILGMMKHKMNYGSMTGGNLRTLGIVKKELADSKLVSDNLESAIKEYEEFNFGEVTTDLSEPERVANMFAYIKGEEILSKSKTLNKFWNIKLDSDHIQDI